MVFDVHVVQCQMTIITEIEIQLYNSRYSSVYDRT